MWLLVVLAGCKPPQADLLTHSFVDPVEVTRVSMFRSCCGHDYSGPKEKNRSMKHYIHPVEEFWNTEDAFPVYAPFDGKVSKIREDDRRLPCYDDVHGEQLFVRPDAQRGVYIKLFHVNPVVKKGDEVKAGQLIAYGDVRECDSSDRSQIADHPSSFDISLENFRGKYPVFDSMTDEAFAAWVEAGVPDRASLEVSEQARDADPCTDYWTECADDMLGLWGNEPYPPYW